MAALDTHEWITIVACAGHLALAIVALGRISRSPLALPLGLLCLDYFGFNAADVAQHLTGGDPWRWLDAVLASVLAPLSVRFALAFVGRSRSLKWLSHCFDFYFGLIALACAGAFFGIGWSRDFAGLLPWAIAVAPGALLTIVVLAWLFISHLRSSQSSLERARTWLVIGGAALGAAGNLCDLLADLGWDVPRLGPLGTLLNTVTFTIAAQRLGLLDRRTSWLIAGNVLVIGAVQICGCLAVFHYFGNNGAMLALGIGILSLGLVPGLLAVTRAAAAQRQRLEYHATLGRFSAQLAHDLRNPLAAIKGAAQYLQVEQSRGNPLGDKREFVDLIVEQADRLGRVIADYQRLARIEAVLKPVNLNAIVSEVLTALGTGGV